MKLSLFMATFLLCYSIIAQDTIVQNQQVRLKATFLSTSKYHSAKKDSTNFKMPPYKQGIICNFEDKLNRKKIPLDFSLGNSKY